MVYLKILIKLLHLLLSFIFFWSLIFDSIDWVRFLLLNVFLMWPDIMYYLPCHPDNPHITTDSWVPAHLYKWVLPKANILFSSLVSPPRWVVRAVSLQPGKKNFLLVLCKISGVFLEIRGENYFSVFFLISLKKVPGDKLLQKFRILYFCINPAAQEMWASPAFHVKADSAFQSKRCIENGLDLWDLN